ncbi:MAG: hypothetical protein H8E26_09140 [FCB group bacterium]|nr:hypothetical protein [FCB group bacterium]MBL7028965.1 hypothetical protein [Candidatus Neomarinimicrobiota bacterium]MBL7121985.1 hypothetical protein [Candidatus Neomarinimicrobiota bacterium]
MICQRPDSITDGPRPTGDSDAFWFTCRRCGTYQATGTLTTMGVNGINRRLQDEHGNILFTPAQFAGWVRGISDRGEDPPLLGSNFIIQLQQAFIPRKLDDRISHFIDVIARRSTTMGELIKFNPSIDYPLAFAENEREFIFLMNMLVSEYGYLTLGSQEAGYTNYLVTSKAWRYFEQLRSEKKMRGTQAFVAMWFNDIVSPAFTAGIKPALEEVGYTPIRIDMVEHNEKIDDEIIAQIRQSGLLIADMTGQRGGVYFEAGFAKGLNIPVIWTIQDREVETEDGSKHEIELIHFDTRQYNFIVWKDAEDLRQRLINRIQATNLAIQ